AEALKKNPRSSLLHVGSKSGERASRFAREMQVPRWGSYDDLLNDKEVDVVYVATTHNFHHETAKLALNHGKHVLLEKPFTVNAEEADELIEIASKKGLFLMEAIWTRFIPSWKKLRSLLESGAIGEVRFIEVTFGKFVPPEFEARLKDPKLAGGATLDLGIYPISFCCDMVGEVPVKEKSLCRFSDLGVDELSCYQLDFPSGAIAQISTSYNLWMEDRAVLYGTKGAVILENFGGGNVLKVLTHNGNSSIENREEIVLSHDENGFVYEVEEIVNCLDQGLRESSIIPLKESRDIMELMDHIRDSIGLVYEFEQ
ncbi:MAG: Gfo/Idh/MocA family oxidoreductase, partial [Spirochaetaceae bacterium]|nr:Gfo/Idh/MocA family oxidoreductase [Spirochaetaceae bacterium]